MGCDDALLLNMQGRVAESTISNIVVQTEEGLITPPVTEGVLPGIARRMLLDAGIMQEQPICYEEMIGAQGVYLTNSLSLRTVTHVDGKRISYHPESYGKVREILEK